jgi:8-oxo-dGTP diphosphatase
LQSVKQINEIDWATWIPKERASLCFLIGDGKILLIHKKTGLGAGMISAPGGRLEPGETPIEAAIREVEEEVGIITRSPKKYGELCFHFADGYTLHGTIFLARDFSGAPVETIEATPFWCSVEEIPYENMWEDDPYWLPFLLQERQFRAYLSYDKEKLVSSRVFIF